jgi:ADP-ribose pyrophosphatase YjhB (NUDIX family)
MQQRHNELLLIKRKRNPFKGSLDIPAGFADGSETLEETLKREMKEEVGLEVTNYKYFKSAAVDYDYKGVIKKCLCAFFIIKVNSKDYKMKAGDDAESCRFYNLNEIDMSEIKFKTTRRIIEDLKLDKCL